MNHFALLKWSGKFSFSILLFTFALSFAQLVTAQTQPVTVSISDENNGKELSPQFLGLSFESSALIPKDGHYYFAPQDTVMVNAFKTLGIKSLRVGANAVDDPRIPVPDTNDIDHLFDFARAAGVKVIYSFRLKNGDPMNSARLASYIAAHDTDALDCFSIGNEPNFYLKTFDAYFAEWKPHFDAILKVVPDAQFDGASATGPYALGLAKAVFATGHLAMASDHYYFLGSGRAGEKDPAANRVRFLSDRLHGVYQRAYNETGAKLAAEGVPYRIDELNSCYNGGAHGSSDTYVSALWALDCIHWWAAHHILGMNFHTGESVGRDGGFGAANYAAFVHLPANQGLEMRPQSYGYLAFSQSAHGQSLPVKINANPKFDFDAYAYRDHDNSIYVTFINKSFGTNAQPAKVSLQLPANVSAQSYQRMDLAQKDNDMAARTGLTLGGAPIDTQGNWNGQWQPIAGTDSADITVEVAPLSAAILHFAAMK
ncbi:MAG TPA: hypothetical protein VHG71_02260 [Verrucomicrobiae bacterium]|nr:hypothetical protein [Verrucomicrobiae bacterium]